jgi:pimeloyl-ACP methyl ester carboxylesterase
MHRVLVFAALTAAAETVEVPFQSHDGHAMFGKLTLPDAPKAVVIYVQTAEGATVDMKRPKPGGTFNYFDLYREKLPPLGVGFFSYEGRGIRMGPRPPRFEDIDEAVYNTSTLDNKVRDALTAAAIVRKRAPGTKIFLMGASEGTFLAAQAAARSPKEIDGLVLYAVLSTTLKDALKYMSSDGNYMVLKNAFDTNNDGRVSRAEWNADARKLRERSMKNVPFETFDVNKDGIFTVEDMRALRKQTTDGIEAEYMDAIDAFLKPTAAVAAPKGWVLDHFSHPPMWTYLAPLQIPVGFFHGDADNLTPIEGVRQLEARAKKEGKTNFHFHYFSGLDHTLNIGNYFTRGELPEGHKTIFEFVQELAR